MLTNVNAAARLDRLPISKWHYKFLAILVAGMIFDNVDFFVLAGVIAKLKQVGWATTEMGASLVSANFFGVFLGCIIAGSLIDRLGRKRLYMYNLLIYSIFTVLCAFAPNFTVLMVLRAITAFGLGGEIAVGYSLIAEYFPPKNRGKWGIAVAVLNNIGMPFAYFLGMIVLPTGDQSWRWLFAICGLPAFYAWYLRKRMPESPRWLESVGRNDEAEKIMSDIENEIVKSTGKELAPVERIIEYKKEKAPPLWALFKKANIKVFFLSAFLFLSVFTLNYSLSTWLPTYFVQQGIEVKKSMLYSTIMVFGNPVGMLLGLLLVEIGRKKAILVVSISGCILAYFYSQAASLGSIIPLGFATIVFIFALAGICQSAYIPELFPTILRGRGVSVTEAIGRLSTIISPPIVVWVMNTYGFGTVIFAVCILFLLVAVMTALLGKETVNRNLEEVNEKQQGMLVG